MPARAGEPTRESVLGLALVAQQAALHGGQVELVDGPLGGLRVILTVAIERD